MTQWEKNVCDYFSNLLWKSKQDVFLLILHIPVNKQVVGKASESGIEQFQTVRFDDYLLWIFQKFVLEQSHVPKKLIAQRPRVTRGLLDCRKVFVYFIK